MKLEIARSLAAVGLVLGLSVLATSPAMAQAAGGGLTRAQVKMDRDTFLSMARWDETVGNYVLKEDMSMPEGVATRAQVKAMRDTFLSMHIWKDNESQWVPINGAPRDMSKLTRAQVKADTERFLKMYRFDESTSKYVPRR